MLNSPELSRWRIARWLSPLQWLAYSSDPHLRLFKLKQLADRFEKCFLLSWKTSLIQSTTQVIPKGGFFSESAIRFSNLQRKCSKNLSWTWNLKLPPITVMLWAGILNFKFRIVFWNIFFWRFGDLKNELHFLKKATFSSVTVLVLSSLYL